MEVASKRAVNGLAALRKAAEEPGAVTTPNGLVFRHIIEGTGPNPGPTDRVSVFYHGELLLMHVLGIYTGSEEIKCAAVLAAWL